MENVKARIAQAGTCLLFSSILTLIFYVAASKLAQYSTMDLYLGSIWTFVLSMIISSPILIPFIRKRMRMGELVENSV